MSAMRDRSQRLRRLLRDERGQGMAEYATTTFILSLALIGAGLSGPVTKVLFDGLQLYIDLFFFSLNMAIG